MPRMTTLESLAKAIVILAALAMLPLTTQAQDPQAATPPAATSDFDPYRAIVVTAGVMGGTALAILVTDGLLPPIYSLLGGGAGGMMHTGYGTVRGAVQLLGAISGAFYADALYMNR